jgi:RNA-directed DNA polymerase
MKTHRNLFPKVWDFENLWLASKKAQLGKRTQPEVYAFSRHLERNLFQLQKELREGAWMPGAYRDFYVYDPKMRLISAAPYRDRVVHHALYRVLEPVFEPRFIYDSYACRPGKGTHAAANRYTQFARKANYVLKCDIRRYFESIQHSNLMSEIRRSITDEPLLALVERILSSNDSREGAKAGQGIPIGNLTSQFFANVYLNRFDHWIKEELGHRFYIRYVDDFVLLHNEKRVLHETLMLIAGYLAGLNLELHPKKQTIFPVSEGCDFMGYRIWRDHRRLRPSSGYRAQRRMKRLAKRFGARIIDMFEVRQSIMAWIGYAKHADTWGLRRAMFDKIVFMRSGVSP